MRLTALVVGFALWLQASVGVAQKVDETPFSIEPVRAFPNLRFNRPIVFTHANDGTNRVFVASQLGQVNLMENNQDAGESDAKVFMDISSRVVYKETENEEGFLGMVFHPQYRDNGQFFVYYTSTEAPHLSVISRFKVSSSDANVADPQYEEELMRIKQPFWNHNGGSMVFGPDGYLYISLGDGGAANDPFGNGQKLEELFGSILRIDVDHKDKGLNYAIPKDNPFVKKRGARPEIYAYGLRNVWGMSFDPETKLFWAADVGQDLWEEIDLIVKGGNYGWNLREGKHKFGSQGSEPRKDLIDPIWEYNHSIGKSITGGLVYRGQKFPELVGHYLYADYITGRIWALKYDIEKKRVVANRPLKDHMLPIISFGVDPQNEVYLTDTFGMIYQLAHVTE